MCWTQAQKRNKTHLRALPDLPAAQTEATENAQKEGEGERMLTEPEACPKRDLKPPEWPPEWLMLREEKTYCWGPYPANNTGFQIAFQLCFSGYSC